MTLRSKSLAESNELTHFDAAGQAQMVDVGAKATSERVALAGGSVLMQPATLELIRSGTSKKGDVLGVARIAGIMAAKRTSDLIPLCHQLALSSVKIEFGLAEPGVLPAVVTIEATVKTTAQTGVEMEALTAVSVAALTIYDMVKAVERGLRIEGIRLLHKSGGKSGTWQSDGG